MSAQESAEGRPGRAGSRKKGRRRVVRRVVQRRDRRLPYPLAAAAVGLLVAVGARVLVFGGERACDLIRGTASCGTAGAFMLLVIAGLMVFVGTRLLRALAVPQAGTTSMLGVALLAIVLLTVLLDQVFSLWMWVVLPLLAAALYAFAAWAAVRLAEAGSG